MAVATRGTRAPVSAPGKTSKATSKSSRKAKTPRARTATRKAVTPPHYHSVLSSKTISRDVVEETPQPDQQSQILELTNRLSQLEEERARTQTQYRVHKSRSHRRHHYRRCNSQSSSDSEEGDSPMVSFLHTEGGPVGPKSSSSRGPFICRNFNKGRCTREHCKYSHICLNYQHDHPVNTCSKTHSATNQIPLKNRISKAE